jgi:hypothetical protein
MRLEGQRREEEAEAARAREAATRRAAAEAEARERAAGEERLRVAEARRHAEALAAREHEARLQAMKEAEMARARHETEAAARAKELLATREHERALTASRDDAGRRKLARATYATIALLAATWVGGGWYSVQAAQRATEDQATNRQATATQKGAIEKLQRAFDEQGEKLASLERDFADLHRAQAPPAQVVPQVTPGRRGVTPERAQPGPASHGTTNPRTPCKDHDPLCTDLP